MKLEPVGARDRFRRQHLLHGAVGDDATIQKDRTGEVDGQYTEVVGTNDRCLTGVGQPFEGVIDQLLCRYIDVVERFVEEHEVGVVGQSAGEHDALLLPAGELTDLAIGQMVDLHRRHRRPNAVVILARRPFEPPQMNVAPHHYDVAHVDRKSPVDGRALRYDGYAVQTAVCRVSVHVDRAAITNLESQDELQERGLSRPVRTDERNPFSRLYGEIHRVEDVLR